MPQRLVAAIHVALAIALFGSASEAQPRDDVAAEALFVEGRKLMDAKRYDEAAEKLRASDRAAPSVGARLSLGDCYRALGKTASAWGAYRSSANLARRGQDNRRAAIAEERARELEPRLSYLRIAVPEASRIPKLEIAWNRASRSRALWDQRFPVDPGEHTISARAAGHAAWEQTITIDKPGERVVGVPRLEPIKAETAPPDPDPDPDPGPQPDPDPGPGPSITRDAPSTFTTGRKVALGLAAVGLVGVVYGSISAARASSKWSDAKSHCSADFECDDEGLDLADSAGSYADQSTLSFAIGGAAIAGAVALWLIAAPADPGEPVATATIGRDRIGLAVSGSF